MITANDISIPAEFQASEPDVSETYGRTVEAPEHATRAAAERLDLIGPLVQGLVALGLADHVVTPKRSGIVWRFGAREAGEVKIDWRITVTPEMEDESLVTVALHATATDTASRERLFEAWPVILDPSPSCTPSVSCTGSSLWPRRPSRIPSASPRKRGREEAELRERR